MSLLALKEQKRQRQNQVFHIRIGSNAEKLNVKDPAFFKLLEQQYATKYLQNLGVEPSSKNISRVLRDYPLEKCEIIESRMNGGLHTDTITITTSSPEELKPATRDSQSISPQMLNKLNLKKMHIQKEVAKAVVEGKPVLEVGEQKQAESALQVLEFGLEQIKEKYIFPFNQNFRRNKHYRMTDTSNLLLDDREDSKAIFEARIFNFPFTMIKLSLKTLKELQTPITTRLVDINIFLEKYLQQFPQNMFPIQAGRTGKRKTLDDIRSKSMAFETGDISRMKEFIRSQQNAKLIGVFLHLAYWSVFGGVNPIQIEGLVKKKMYIVMFETLQYFQIKVDDNRLWMTLIMPMIILTLKMASHYFFAIQFPLLFQSQEALKIDAHSLATDKLIFFIEKLFDQTNISGRFIFLESDINGEKGSFIKEKKFIRKRIFGTSPAMNLILPHPRDGKTRAILARNLQVDQRDGTMEDKYFRTEEKIDKASHQKLLNLAMHKINNRLQSLMGNNTNPILNIKMD